MKQYKALDLFCGAGGATKGLQLAGFHVTGVDNRPQPRYCGDAFVRADALAPPFRLSDFDLVWASPPCQGYSIMRNLPWLQGRTWPKLIEPVRAMLRASGVPHVIENVVGAPLENVSMLCGLMFGLPLYRHRLFETTFLVAVPAHPRHHLLIGRGRRINDRAKPAANGFISLVGKASVEARAAVGLGWMTGAEATQSIPPAFAEHIGTYARLALEAVA